MLVSIDQCHFRGTELAIQQARQALDHVRFPDVGDTQYVILRELSVSAKLPQLAQQYVYQSEKIIADRVNGWSDSAISANCIWFLSESDLYACLCRDMVLGRASNTWFWKSFSYLLTGTIADNLTQIFQQQGRQLPVFIQLLYEHNILSEVWKEITVQAAESLVGTLVNGTVGEIIKYACSQKMLYSKRKDNFQIPALLEVLLEDKTFDSVTISIKQQLAITLYLQLDKPHWLASASSTALIEGFVQQLMLSASHQSDQYRPLAYPPKDNDELGRGNFNKHFSENEEENSSRVENDYVNDSSEIVANANSKTNKLDEKLSALKSTELNTEHYETKIATQQQHEFTHDEAWNVSQGGLFYLLNVLNQPFIRKQLLQDKKAIAFPSGWGWLYRLGEAFGLQYERELVRCLSALSGIDEQQFISAMPALDMAADIREFASQRYPHYVMKNQNLFNKPAFITFKRPELMITFSLQDVDISIRKAGLDIDPGWVDWLATMVRFHYREGM